MIILAIFDIESIMWSIFTLMSNSSSQHFCLAKLTCYPHSTIPQYLTALSKHHAIFCLYEFNSGFLIEIRLHNICLFLLFLIYFSHCSQDSFVLYHVTKSLTFHSWIISQHVFVTYPVLSLTHLNMNNTKYSYSGYCW